MLSNTIKTQNNLSKNHYYCTVADEKHFYMLLNLIGSLHKNDFDNLKEIAVFDLGFTDQQKQILKNIKKVEIYTPKFNYEVHRLNM